MRGKCTTSNEDINLITQLLNERKRIRGYLKKEEMRLGEMRKTLRNISDESLMRKFEISKPELIRVLSRVKYKLSRPDDNIEENV